MNIIELHGRDDDVSPPEGGPDKVVWGGWLYESLNNTFYVLGMVQKCDLKSWQKIETPWDHYVNPNKSSSIGNNLECYSYTQGCTGRLMQCMYDGGHEVITDYTTELTWWFWTSVNNKYSKS